LNRLDRPPHEKVISLSLAGKGNFVSKRSKFIQILWHLIEIFIINNSLIVFSFPRIFFLRAFGAVIGENCLFLHPMRVKYPWNFKVGDNCWFGRDAWIYNQEKITIGSDVVISQGVFLTAGSHNVSTNMDLHVAPIIINDGVWISSYSVVQMGVNIGKSAVVTPLSVVSKSLEQMGIYGGTPGRFIKNRFS